MPAVPGVATSVLCKVGRLWQQLDNQLSKPRPSPVDTRQLPWPLGQPSAGLLRQGRGGLNNHLYRNNILLQKVPELSPWSKNLTENKQQKSAADTSWNLVHMKLSAGQGPKHKLLFAEPWALSFTCCGPLEEKLATGATNTALGPKTEVTSVGPAGGGGKGEALAFTHGQAASPASGPGLG